MGGRVVIIQFSWSLTSVDERALRNAISGGRRGARNTWAAYEAVIWIHLQIGVHCWFKIAPAHDDEIQDLDGWRWKEKSDMSVGCHAFVYLYGINKRNLSRLRNSCFDVQDFYENLLIKIVLIKLKVYCGNLCQLNKNMGNRITIVDLLKFK